MKKKTTYAFIDATNIIYGAGNNGWGVDSKNVKQLRFYEKLQEFGYLLRLIPVKKFKDGQKKRDRPYERIYPSGLCNYYNKEKNKSRGERMIKTLQIDQSGKIEQTNKDSAAAGVEIEKNFKLKNAI